MSKLINSFMDSWAQEIIAYKEVRALLEQQKQALLDWDIDTFGHISTGLEQQLHKAHQYTDLRQSLMEALVLTYGQIEKYDLRNIYMLLPDQYLADKAEVFFQGFADLLREIDNLTKTNQQLISNGLDLVGDNIELVADLAGQTKNYTHTGRQQQLRPAVMVSRQV